MDDLDKAIVARLGENGRASNKDVAERLKVSEGTIRNRIRKLIDSGMLKVAGAINPEADPEKQLIILGVKLAASKDLAVKAEEIAALPGVLSVGITTGRYDLIVETWVDVKFGLIRFLSDTLANVEGVVSTESFLVMRGFHKWIAPENDA